MSYIYRSRISIYHLRASLILFTSKSRFGCKYERYEGHFIDPYKYVALEYTLSKQNASLCQYKWREVSILHGAASIGNSVVCSTPQGTTTGRLE